MDVDMIPRGFKPTYINFDESGTFSVSKEDGDIAGIYSVEKRLLRLSSDDQKWYNRTWRVHSTENELVLNDLKNSFRGAQMRFNKVDQFPSFTEFLDRLNGEWDLYKVVKNGKEQRIKNTRFFIDNDRYTMTELGQTLEKGSISVDTRHHKITFENMDVIWNIRFVWDDLRLENEELGLMYRLRKIKQE